MLSLASLFAFAALVAAQATDPSIATPAAVVQCQPAQISWTASKTPAFISIIPGGQPSAAPLQDFGKQEGTTLTWTVNIASGTNITFVVRDSTGTVAYSAPVTIQTSSDSSCLGAGASSSGGASASTSQIGSASVSSSAASVSTSSVAASSSSAASVSSSVSAATSSIIESVSSAVSTATAPATTSRATSASSTRSAASATSATPSASTTPNSARSNMQVGFAGLIGLAAAVVIA